MSWRVLANRPPLSLMAWAAIALIACTVVVAATGLSGLRFDSHYSAYFDRNDAAIVQHDAILADFHKHDAAVVILNSVTGTFLEPDQYQLLEDVSGALGRLPCVTNTMSIPDLAIVGEREFADGLTVPSEQQIREHGIAGGLLLSADAKFAVIRVDMALPDRSAATVLAAMGDLRSTLLALTGDRSIAVHVTGTLALSDAYISVVRHDLRIIMPFLLLTMCAVVAWLLGGPRSLLVVLPVGLLSVVASFGLIGLFGVALAAVNAFVPVIIFSISLAACVHVVTGFQARRQTGADPEAATLGAIRENLSPLILANGTTALAFLGLALSPSPPIRTLGYLVAVGVAFSFLFSITLLPALLVRLDPQARPAVRLQRFVQIVTHAAIRFRVAVVIGAVVLSAFAIASIASNEVGDDVLDYFPASHPFHVDTQIASDHLSGISEVFYSVDVGTSDALFQTKTIIALQSFAAWLDAQPEVLRVATVANAPVIREAQADGRLEDRLDHYRRALAKNEPASPLLQQTLSEDYTATLVTAYLRPLRSAQLTDFEVRRHRWTSEHLPEFRVAAGGPTLMFAILGQKNIRSMLLSLGIGLMIASVIIGMVYRSPKIGFVSFVVNLFPIIMVYGVWAVFVGTISIGASVVMGMVLGILIDDSVYVLTAHERVPVTSGQNRVVDAIQYVGRPLIITTVTLVAGLAAGLLSDFEPIWSMSALSAAVIFLGLFSDIILLPALMVSLRERART